MLGRPASLGTAKQLGVGAMLRRAAARISARKRRSADLIGCAPVKQFTSACFLVCALWSAASCSSSSGSGTQGVGAASGSAGSGNGGSAGSGNGGSGAAASGGSAGTLGPLDSGAGGSTGPQTPVQVVITADNAYGFGYGDANGLFNYFGGIENPAEGDIFDCPVGIGPEAYTVPAGSANAGNYLYIIGYSDKSVTQGVIAQFFRAGAAPVYTGNGAWTACATGQNFNVGTGGPALEAINHRIGICNAKSGDPATSSVGWVDTTLGPNGAVAFGEDNTTDRTSITPGNEFKVACGIDAAARWMWYQWDPTGAQDPFIWPGGPQSLAKEFIIFRLGAEHVPEPPR
jgi:hypothetical protein